MARVSYNRSSPYFRTPQTSWYLANYVHRQIPPSIDDYLWEIEDKYDERPDLAAFDLYNTDAYWWVFMVKNMNIIKDPIFDFKTGTTLVVPTLGSLQRAL